MRKKNTIPNPGSMKNTDNDDRCWWWLASLFMALMLVIIATACREELEPTVTEAEGLPATIRLEVTPGTTTQAQTRASETAIKDLHVLVYNSKGELIGKSYGTSSTLTVKTRSGSNCTLYAIANTGNATLFDGVAVTEAKLKAMKTSALSAWDGLDKATHLIMAGSKTKISISAGSSTLSGGMTVERLVAKVTLNIAVKAGSGITIKDYQVCSLPKQSLYVLNNTADGATAWMEGTKTTVDAASISKTFFMYENRRGIVNTITAQKDKGEAKAPTSATYVIINGKANGYNATWRVYLGENNTNDFNINRNTPYKYNITLNRPGADGADTRVTVEDLCPIVVGNNSNCYMVNPGNAVTVPVERANESPIELVGSTLANGTYYQLQTSTTWIASIVWESSKGLVTLSETTGTGPSGRFKVTATDASAQGNAVVAIKNDSGEILWSWHIWVTTYDGSTQFTNNNGNRSVVFMNRALGASTSTANQLTSCGLMYQWGRKDPFPGIGQEGGSWTISDNTDPIRIYNALGTLYAINRIPVPNVTPNNLTNATRNPDTFYYNTNSLGDWFVYNSSSSQNNDLWSGSNITLGTAAKKSVFDPCPAGWRIPPYLNNTSPFAGMVSGSNWGSYGPIWPGTGGYFPTSGLRLFNSGLLASVRWAGYSWSGLSDDTKGIYFGFTVEAVHPAVKNPRGFGIPVRCSKDE